MENGFIKSILEHSTDAIVVFDKNWHPLHKSQAFKRNMERFNISDEVLVAALRKSKSSSIFLNQRVLKIHRFSFDQYFGYIISYIDDSEVIENEKYRVIAENTQEAIIYFEGDCVGYVSQQFSDISGFSREDIPDLDAFVSLIHPQEQEGFNSIWKEGVQESLSNTTYSHRLLQKNGGYLWFENHVRRGNDQMSDQTLSILTLNDITEVVEAKEQVRESEDRFNLLMSETGNFLVAMENEIVTYISPSFSNLGYELKQLSNSSDLRKLMHPVDLKARKKAIKSDIALKSVNSSYQFRLKRSNGEFAWYEEFIRRTYNENGEVKASISHFKDITKHKTSENQIRENKEFLNDVTDAVPDALYVLDTENFTYLFWNESFEKVIGHSVEDLEERSPFFFLSHIHHKDLDSFFDLAKKVKNVEQDYYEITFRIKDKVGQYRHLHTRVFPFENVDSRKNQVICLTRNITSQVKAKQEIDEIKQKYQLAIDASSSGIWDRNIVTNEVYIEPRIKEILGFKDQEFPNEMHIWSERIHPDDFDRVENAHKDVTQGKTEVLEVAYRMKHKNGSYRWILTKGKSVEIEDGRVVRMMGTDTDITKIKDYELALAQSEESYRELAESLSDIFFGLDKNLKFTYWNKTCESIFGFTSKEVMGKQLYHVLPDFREKPIEEAILNTVIKNQSYTRRYYSKEQDKTFEIKTYPSKNGLSLFARDVTEKMQYERELIDSKQFAENALKTKDEFLSVMSHEIRTPLNAVIGLTHLLLENSPRKDQIDTLNTLKISSDNLISLVNDVLDYSSIQSGKIELTEIDFDVRLLLNNLIKVQRTQADQKNLSFEFIWDDRIPRFIKGDKIRLGQIVNNLINNAIKFTENGFIRVIVDLVKDTKKTAIICVCVRDSGVGISKADQQRVFEPFQQVKKDMNRKFGGTGLGLSITKNLIEMMQGAVTVESEESVGSTFKITIPFRKSNPKQSKQLVNNGGHNQSKEFADEISILYVDDIATNQFLMEGFCAKWNVKLDKALSGFEALDKLKKEKYDCILMDIQMPEMNGFETSRKIRDFEGNYFKKVPIIAYTAEVSEAGLHKVLESGMNDLLTKPVDPNELFVKISNHSGKTLKENASKISARVKANEMNISFADLDDLYDDSPEMYADFLTQLEDEANQNSKALQESIENDDVKTFREVKHKMQTSLKVMKFHDFVNYLEKVKGEFIEGKLDNEAKQVISTKISTYSDYLINRLAQKVEGIFTKS